ncbi:MAG: hypothetical protein Q9191_006100 [Dirinaria sp. TL-2023a]
MERDRSMGRGHWRGCHSFTGITCDGDTSVYGGRRDGGLLMGGTYWYYYRFDGDIEYYDPAEPYTNKCPLLPGQGVNILEVPVQAKPSMSKGPSASTSSFSSAVFTMDPKAKYLSPKPSAHRTVASRLSIVSKSSLANLSARFARLIVRQLPDHSKISCRSTKQRCKSSGYSPERCSPAASFQTQRATKSAGDEPPHESQNSLVATKRKVSGSARDIHRHAEEAVTATLAKTATNVHHASGVTEAQSDSPALCSSGPQAPPNTAQRSVYPPKRSSSPPAEFDSLTRLALGKAISHSTDDSEVPHEWYDAGNCNIVSARSSSYFSNDVCSLSFGQSTDPTSSLSPQRSSHSESPFSGEMSWIEDRPDASIAYSVYRPTETSEIGLPLSSPHFSGYSPSEADHGSMLTIKEPQSAPFEPLGFRSPLHQNDSQIRVQAWNDATKHPASALEELIDDLGYLGELII